MALKSFKEFLNEEEQLDEFLAALGAGLGRAATSLGVSTATQTAVKTGISTAAKTGGMSLVRAGRQAAPELTKRVVGGIQAIRKGNIDKILSTGKSIVSNGMSLVGNNNSTQQEPAAKQEPLMPSGGGMGMENAPMVQSVSNNRPASLSTGGQTIKGSATGTFGASQQTAMNTLYGQNNIGRFRR